MSLAVEIEEPRRGKGRQRGFRMSEYHRDKIRNSNILKVLIQHVEGKREMSSTQVTAGLGLLRKVLPDLASVTVGGDENNPLTIQTTRQLVIPEDAPLEDLYALERVLRATVQMQLEAPKVIEGTVDNGE